MRIIIFVSTLFLFSVLTLAMSVVGTLPGFINAQNCVPNGDYLYLLDRYTMFVIDISNPALPVKIDSLATSQYVLNLAIHGDYAFLGAGPDIMVIDISDPAHPVELSTISLSASDYAYGIGYYDGYVYAGATNVLKIYQFTPPSPLTEVYSFPYICKSVSADDNIAAFESAGNLLVSNVTNPAAPIPIGGSPTPGYTVDITVDGDRIYIADGAEVGVGTGHVLLILTDTPTSIAGQFVSDDGNCRHGCAYGTQYFVANGNYGFQLIDWTTPASPVVADEYVLPAGATVDANIAYPHIYAITRDELIVFTSEELVDTSGGTVDRTPPEITLLMPLDGTVSSCEDQSIKILITDDISGVDWSTVEIDIDGAAYDITSPEISLAGDTLTFYPLADWSDGEVITFAIIAVSDNEGNALESPVSAFFTVDLTSPVINVNYPEDGDSVATPTPEINFSLEDDISSVDSSAVLFTFDGAPIEHWEFEWESIMNGYELTYTPEPLGPGMHVVCITNLCDEIDYCAPNCITADCWSFAVVTSEGPIISLLEPNFGAYSSCTSQRIMLRITDPDGVDWSSVELTVEDAEYPIEDLTLSGDTVIFYPATAWEDGQQVDWSLAPVSDPLGNYSIAIDGYFVADLSPPIVIPIYPAHGETLTYFAPEMAFMIVDSGAGLMLTEDWYARDWRRLEHDDLNWEPDGYGFWVTYTPDSLPDGEHRFAAYNLFDAGEVCGANLLMEYTWTFYINTADIAEIKLPEKIGLKVSPNPFNSSVAIELRLPNPESGELYIVDGTGRIVESIFSGTTSSMHRIWQPDNLPSGNYKIIWNGESRLVHDVSFVK